MEREQDTIPSTHYATALERLVHRYYSSGFWAGFITGVATGAMVTVSLVRWRKN